MSPGLFCYLSPRPLTMPFSLTYRRVGHDATEARGPGPHEELAEEAEVWAPPGHCNDGPTRHKT